jgi:hypothetical protein
MTQFVPQRTLQGLLPSALASSPVPNDALIAAKAAALVTSVVGKPNIYIHDP